MKKICLIIGDPVSHSLSPLMQNAGFAALALADFVYLAAQVKPDNLGSAVSGLKALGFIGASVTVPHKEAVIPLLDSIDPDAKKIGAVNTIINRAGHMQGSNTDWVGIVESLAKHTKLAGKKVAIFGAGGTARAACFGFEKNAAEFTVFNRTVSRAEALAKEFGGAYSEISRFKGNKFDIIFQATTVGLNSNQSVVPLEQIKTDHIVFDAVYIPVWTTLLNAARQKGALAICGLDLLLYQGLEQFKMFTGKAAPQDAMRRALYGAAGGPKL